MRRRSVKRKTWATIFEEVSRNFRFPSNMRTRGWSISTSGIGVRRSSC
ncbi:hypothetical protein GBAR_LOCUS10559 [Geodia barretti]|uniref:Uncharacterized protein n=1 Tax=Geodia barretti TaxID=519541 RepID=A0AA35WK62_GEOBA|nr:hypothetical protein GBAR_LOCUS10559 [Geodia barretti]